MRVIVFPELSPQKGLDGTQKAVREAANREGRAASEFIRQAIRARLRRADHVAGSD